MSPFCPSFLQPPALHPQNDRFLTPLFSSTSELLFSQLLCFHIYLRCPLLFSPALFKDLPRSPQALSPLSTAFTPNRSLSPLSTAFTQNTGRGVPTGSLGTHLTPMPSHFMLWRRIPGASVLVRNFIFWLSTKRGVTNAIARRGMKHGFARRFVAGETLAEALTASRELCDHGRNVSLNHLG